MTDNIVKEKLISEITQGLKESLLADRDAEIAELKQELRELREGQIISHSNIAFRLFCAYLWSRQEYDPAMEFFDGNRCRFMHWQIVNHGSEFEIHHAIFKRCYLGISKGGEKAFFRDNKFFTGCNAYIGKFKDPYLKMNGEESYFFRLIEPYE